MKCAMFPGQQEALALRIAEVRAEGQRRLNRRVALAIGLGGFVGMTSGCLATLGLTASARAARGTLLRPAGVVPASTGDLTWARRLAVGDLSELLGAADRFAEVVGRVEHADDLLWVGVARLSNAAVDGHRLATPALAARLRPLTERQDVPVTVRHLLRLAGASSG